MQEKLTQLITKLTLSGLPPSFQEHVLSRVHELDEETVDKLIRVLTDMTDTTVNVQRKGAEYHKVLQEVVAAGEEKQRATAKEVEQALIAKYTQSRTS